MVDPIAGLGCAGVDGWVVVIAVNALCPAVTVVVHELNEAVAVSVDCIFARLVGFRVDAGIRVVAVALRPRQPFVRFARLDQFCPVAVTVLVLVPVGRLTRR